MSEQSKQQIIRVSAGAVEYTYPVTLEDDLGTDITADTIKISLGSRSAPGVWRDPDLKSYPTISSVTVQLLVGPGYLNPAPDDYQVWVKLTDNPEIVPRRVGLRVTIL